MDDRNPTGGFVVTTRGKGTAGRSLSGTMLPLGTLLHEFEILDLIGEGGFSYVYLARDHSLQRVVAVKEYLPVSLATRDDGIRVVARTEKSQSTFDAGLRSF